MTSTLRVPLMAPGSAPLVGHGLLMKRRGGEFLTSLQNGDAVTVIRLGRQEMYVVNDPALIRNVLRDSETFARGGLITDRFRTMFGNGLGISEGDFHRRQRSLIQPAFHHKRIAGHAALMSRAAREKANSWEDGQRVEVDAVMDDLALANVTKLIVAEDAALDTARFMAATATVLGGLFRRMTDNTGVLTRLPTPSNRRYLAAARYIRSTILDVISEYRAAGVDRGDLLSMMLFARDGNGDPAMSDQQLHDEVMTFLIGGSNTVSNTLAWTFHELATHSEVEQRLHGELDEVLGGRVVEYGDVAHLQFTRQVLTETLRVRTQGLFLTRVTTTATELGGYRIPGGVPVLYSFHALNHNPAIHPEPDRFDPDRWHPDRAGETPRGAFIPFSLGVHGCIGDQFAWTEMIITLATISARWRLASLPGHQPRPKPAITMPVDALPMTVHRRRLMPVVGVTS